MASTTASQALEMIFDGVIAHLTPIDNSAIMDLQEKMVWTTGISIWTT
jgi:hypothetical protein